jgi:nitroreductase
MNQTLDLLRTRRSVAPRLLVAPGPSSEELEDFLAVACRVPDHGRLAPWRFIVLAGEAQARLGEAVVAAYLADQPKADPEQIAKERGRLTEAPVVVAVVSRAKPHVKIPEWEQVLSAGAVCMNLVVAANAAGYGTSWLTEWFGYDRRILDLIGLEANERVAGFIHIGTARNRPAERARPILADLVTRL